MGGGETVHVSGGRGFEQSGGAGDDAPVPSS